ncbi:hypothetical protein Tco_0690132 [Tanacetum coccineum]
MYSKRPQHEHPGLYAITQDQSDPATRLIPDREEILTLAEESRSKLNKDFVKPFDYTKLNNLKYVESLEDELGERELIREVFSNMYDIAFARILYNSSYSLLTLKKDWHHNFYSRTPDRNGVVERESNLVEAARTMLSASKLPLFDEFKEMYETSVANNTSGLVPQRQKASDYDNPCPPPELQNGYPSADTTVPITSGVGSFFLHTTVTNIQPTSEPSTPTNTHAEENTDDQAEFTNPFCTPVQEIAESSSRMIVAAGRLSGLSVDMLHKVFSNLSDGRKNAFLNGPLKEEVYVAQPEDSLICHLTEIIRYLKMVPFHMGLWSIEGSALIQAFSVVRSCRVALILAKATLRNTIPGDKLVSWMSKKKVCTANVIPQS